MSEREDLVKHLAAKTGKTEEQMDAFMDILGPAFRRRGWAEGEPMSQEEIGQKLGTYLGTYLGGAR